jgi:hypothetical protein
MATHYDLTVTCAVTPADDIDLLAEGTYARDRYDSPADALGDLACLIRDNSGRDAWSETDPRGGLLLAAVRRGHRDLLLGADGPCDRGRGPDVDATSDQAAARPRDVGPPQRRQLRRPAEPGHRLADAQRGAAVTPANESAA